MNKYFLKPGTSGLVSVDSETFDINVVNYTRTGIDWIYEVPEDGTLTVQDSNVVDVPVKKGNLVVLFYKDFGLKHRAVVIDNDEWAENIEAYKAKQLEEAKKYANGAQNLADSPQCEAYAIGRSKEDCAA